MGNDKNITEGKNGKLYYGKGTKGGMATQPTTPNSDIRKVDISSNKNISPISSDLPDLATTEAASKAAHQEWVNKTKIWNEARNANPAWVKAEQSRLAAMNLSTGSYGLAVTVVNNIEKSDPNIVKALHDKNAAEMVFGNASNIHRSRQLTVELIAEKSKLNSYLETLSDLESIMPKVVKDLFDARKKIKTSDSIDGHDPEAIYRVNRKQLKLLVDLLYEMDNTKENIDMLEKDIKIYENPKFGMKNGMLTHG